MAQKRMFDKNLIDSDLFIDLPIPSQCLYFHLSMRADDEGFIGNVKGILRLVGFKNEDLRPLIERQFILIFETGVIVIKHWKINNYLRSDRFKPTTYTNEKDRLEVDNDIYNFVYQPTTNGTPSIEEKRIEEIRLEEIRIDKNKGQSPNGVTPMSEKQDINTSSTKKKKFGEYKHILLNENELLNLKNEFPNYLDLIKYLDEAIEMKGYKYKNHYLAIKKWVVDAVKDSNNKNVNKNSSSKSTAVNDVLKEVYDGTITVS